VVFSQLYKDTAFFRKPDFAQNKTNDMLSSKEQYFGKTGLLVLLVLGAPANKKPPCIGWLLRNLYRPLRGAGA
jgi:hypothetical protein